MATISKGGYVDRTQAIDQIRYFNRAYTPLMDLLSQNYIEAGHPLTEARLMFEIQDLHECSASQLCANLHLDKGYLSRILKRFAAEGYIERAQSPADGRVTLIKITAAGETYAERLAQGGRQLVASVVEQLTDAQLAELVGHMSAIEELLAIAMPGASGDASAATPTTSKEA